MQVISKIGEVSTWPIGRAVATIGAWGSIAPPPPPIGIPPFHQTSGKLLQWQYFYGDSVETLRILRNLLSNFGGFASEHPFYLLIIALYSTLKSTKVKLSFTIDLAFDRLVTQTEGQWVPEVVGGWQKIETSA